MENRQKHVTGMFPFRIIKCLRTHENLSHSVIHLSIAEPIQGFNFGLNTAYPFIECNQTSLRRNEQRRYFCNENISALWSWRSKHPESGAVTLTCSTSPNVFHVFMGKVCSCWCSQGYVMFQSTLCQVFRELANCYASNENKTVQPKRSLFFFFISLNNLFP